MGWIKLTTSKYQILNTEKGKVAMLPYAPTAPKSDEEVTEDKTAKKPKNPPGRHDDVDTDTAIKTEMDNLKVEDSALIARPDVGPWSA
jgi:hypothetical protein